MMTHRGTQIIKTKRLILRKIISDDAEMLYKIMSDPEVLRYEDWDVHDNIDFTRGFISYLTDNYKTEQTYCWGIEFDNDLIGLVMVVNVHEWNGVLAYYLRRDCWSKGYATEAAIAVIDYMFAEVEIEKVSAKHCVKNVASGKVLLKSGMTYKGHVDEFEYYSSKSEWQDCDFYAIKNNK